MQRLRRTQNTFFIAIHALVNYVIEISKEINVIIILLYIEISSLNENCHVIWNNLFYKRKDDRW
jgi:hypothetical protein